MSGERGRGRVTRPWIGGLALALAAAALAVWLLLPGWSTEDAARAPSRSPAGKAFDRAFARELERLTQLPEFQRRLAGLPPEELRVAVMELAVRGMVRLDDALLLARVMLLSRMLDGVDVATCGAIARGKAGAAQLEHAVEALDPRSVERWVALCARAAEAELRNTTAPSFDPARTNGALAVLVRRFAPEEGKRLAATLGRLPEQNDADACWAARTVYRQVPSLGEPHAQMLARVLAR